MSYSPRCAPDARLTTLIENRDGCPGGETVETAAGRVRPLVAELAASDPFTLAALQTLASLAASLVVALAAIRPGADADALWAAAELEEEWQAELWGREAEAELRRARRFAAFSAAIRFARLATGEP